MWHIAQHTNHHNIKTKTTMRRDSWFLVLRVRRLKFPLHANNSTEVNKLKTQQLFQAVKEKWGQWERKCPQPWRDRQGRAGSEDLHTDSCEQRFRLCTPSKGNISRKKPSTVVNHVLYIHWGYLYSLQMLARPIRRQPTVCETGVQELDHRLTESIVK